MDSTSCDHACGAIRRMQKSHLLRGQRPPAHGGLGPAQPRPIARGGGVHVKLQSDARAGDARPDTRCEAWGEQIYRAMLCACRDVKDGGARTGLAVLSYREPAHTPGCTLHHYPAIQSTETCPPWCVRTLDELNIRLCAMQAIGYRRVGRVPEAS